LYDQINDDVNRISGFVKQWSTHRRPTCFQFMTSGNDTENSVSVGLAPFL